MKRCFYSIIIALIIVSCNHDKHEVSLPLIDNEIHTIDSFLLIPPTHVNINDPIEIAETKGYELGFDKGFDDAGAAMYNDEDIPKYDDKSLQSYFEKAFLRGYEDGWIEWKNINKEEDY